MGDTDDVGLRLFVPLSVLDGLAVLESDTFEVMVGEPLRVGDGECVVLGDGLCDGVIDRLRLGERDSEGVDEFVKVVVRDNETLLVGLGPLRLCVILTERVALGVRDLEVSSVSVIVSEWVVVKLNCCVNDTLLDTSFVADCIERLGLRVTECEMERASSDGDNERVLEVSLVGDRFVLDFVWERVSVLVLLIA